MLTSERNDAPVPDLNYAAARNLRQHPYGANLSSILNDRFGGLFSATVRVSRSGSVIF